MQPVDFQIMSEPELKAYWRAHPHDAAAQRAYFDRLNQVPRRVITIIEG